MLVLYARSTVHVASANAPMKEILLMKRTTLFVLLFGTLAWSGAAQAQIWVSNAGNDSNGCTLTAPCKTFQRAVTVAPSYGIVHVLTAGDYGQVSVSKPLEIDGGGLATITIYGSSNSAITVNPSGGVVQIRNLAIHGYAGAIQGIAAQGSGGVDIDNVQVTGISGNCISAAPTGNMDIVIKDTSVENCSQNGLYIQGMTGAATSVKLVNTHVRYANGGMVAAVGVTVSAFHSTFSSPGAPSASTGSIGVEVEGGSLVLDDCEVSGWGTGVDAYGGNAQVSRSSFIDNWVAVSASGGGTLVTNGNNSFLANNSIGTFTSKVALQ